MTKTRSKQVPDLRPFLTQLFGLKIKNKFLFFIKKNKIYFLFLKKLIFFKKKEEDNISSERSIVSRLSPRRGQVLFEEIVCRLYTHPSLAAISLRSLSSLARGRL